MKKMINIEVQNFSYKGSASAGLHDISLHIKDGETVLLCGASGCGKTTVLRLINGLIPHYYRGELNGRITVNGIDIPSAELYDLASIVGTVFQNPRSQFFSVDTDGEITFGTENIGIDPDEILKRKSEVVNELELKPLLGKSLFELSGGEKQKIACAGVSALMPDVMLLDEPSSNLDWKAIEELKKVIKHWKAKGKTIIISEHRLWYLKNLIDRVIYMKDGRIEKEWNKAGFNSLTSDELCALGLRPTEIEEKYIEEFGRGIFSTENIHPCSTLSSESRITLKDMFFTYKPQKYFIKKKKLNAADSADYTLAIPELEIPRGKVIGLIGKNGAGKSTFLRCLCGLEKDCTLRLTSDEETVSGRKILKKCYMVMQDVNHQLFTDSVEAEVMLSMDNEDKDQAAKIIAELGLAGYENTHPMALSGGQKQRVAIASALAANAEILLFDEPTSGLDHAHMTSVADLLTELAKKGRTIIVSTHDPELISLCCDHILCLEKGRLKYMRKC
ncbi:energy-coupling factor transport system ATP-binding protein [Ruminococcus albus]|uniref:Energy-coupling factor transport system ATP-binding protein n=2 Tax=Ruminococcus albus TaxID=1264 RepID=A0A1H7MEH6_RUMAL|nr:energy-coupling factor transport system ATP-binding protein [Ruminococcus albus]